LPATIRHHAVQSLCNYNCARPFQILSAYHEYMTEVGVLLGGEKNSTRKQMLEVIELETKLAGITATLEQKRNEAKTYHRMSLNDLTVSFVACGVVLIKRCFVPKRFRKHRVFFVFFSTSSCHSSARVCLDSFTGARVFKRTTYIFVRCFCESKKLFA